MFEGKAGLQQRVLPAYRLPFMDALAGACVGGLGVFAGQPVAIENILTGESLQQAHLTPAQNRHWLHPGSPFYQCWQPNLLAWLENWNPDVLIVEANPRYPDNRSAIRWMHHHGRPVVGWGLGAPAVPTRRIWQRLLAGWRQRARHSLINSLDVLIAYSRNGAEEYRALGFPADRILVAANAAVARPGFPPPQRALQPDQPASLLFVGRLQARKRVDLLLQACAALPAGLRPRLRIVGDGPARAELQSLAARIYPQAEFTGARQGAELEDLFRQADLFVLPGTGGLAVQQAMSYALPVIVAQGDGTQDDLVRPENGWRIPQADLPALLIALQTALADPLHLRAMGMNSYRIVADEINLENMVAVFVRAMQLALTRPSAAD